MASSARWVEPPPAASPRDGGGGRAGKRAALLPGLALLAVALTALGVMVASARHFEPARCTSSSVLAALGLAGSRDGAPEGGSVTVGAAAAGGSRTLATDCGSGGGGSGAAAARAVAGASSVASAAAGARPPRPVVVNDGWLLHPRHIVDPGPHDNPNATAPFPVAADVFLADGCLKFASVITCDHPGLNFSHVQPQVTAVWDAAACPDGASDAACDAAAPVAGAAVPRRPVSRLLHRDGYNWSPTTVGELCLPQLAGAARANVTLWYGAQSKRYTLRRVPRAPRSEFGMMVMYRGDAWTAPAWLDVWAALGVGHFYVYFDGTAGEMRAEHPAVVRALEHDPRVTLHTWPYPLRSVILDPTGTSTLPEVNRYGKVRCYLHYAKLMAFNAAYHRYGSRHAYMGFFDFDEYLGLPQRYFDAAAAAGTSPLHELRAAHADPQTFVVQNRWAALLPAPLPPPPAAVGGAGDERLPAPLTAAGLLARRIVGGPHTGWGARSKFFVRSDGVGGRDGGSVPWMVGNHYVCRLRDAHHVGPKRAILQHSGRCDQPVLGTPAIVRLEPPDYYSLHLLNLKPHESLLDFDEGALLAGMAANRTELPQLHALLRRAGHGGGGGGGGGGGAGSLRGSGGGGGAALGAAAGAGAVSRA